MSVLRINRDPSRRQLNVFGLCWLLALAFGGLRLHDRGAGWIAAGLVWAAAVLVPAIGLLAPRFLRMIYLGVAYVTFPIGFVLSHVLLGAVYYLVLTPTGLLMRACGRDPLTRRFDGTADSYWVRKKPADDAGRYLRQS